MKSCNSTPELFRFYFTRLLVVLFLFITLVSFGRKHNEGAGLSADNNRLFKAAPSPLPIESMRINLYLLNANNTTILADGALTEYKNIFHDGVTLEDAYKFTNINENLGLARYGSVLAVERRPVITARDTLFLKLWKTTIRNYQFEFVTTNLDHPGMQAMLKDAFLGTSIALSLNGTTKINFSITNDAASSGVSRFQIIYHESFNGTLLVVFASIKGYRLNNSVTIDWKVENEINIESYEIQHSADGTNFFKVKSVVASAHTSGYSWVDNQAVNGNNYYRIKSVDRDGSGKFSTIVKIAAAVQNGGPRSVLIYPNPVRGSSINLRFINQPLGEYELKLINSIGQVVYSGKLAVNSSDISQPFITNQKLRRGIYQLEIRAPDNSMYTKQALVQE